MVDMLYMRADAPNDVHTSQLCQGSTEHMLDLGYQEELSVYKQLQWA